MITGNNKWTYCEYDQIGVGFPNRCGVTGRTHYQSSQFATSCSEASDSWWHSSTTKEIIWAIYDPSILEDEYNLDWYPSNIVSDFRSNGMPTFLSTKTNSTRLDHVIINGVGGSNSYALSTGRGETFYKNLTISSESARGLRVTEVGSFNFEDLSIFVDLVATGFTVSISDSVDVNMERVTIETFSSAIEVVGSSSLSIYDAEVHLQYSFSYGFYIRTSSHVEIDRLTYIDNSYQYYALIYLSSGIEDFSMKNSQILCDDCEFQLVSLSGSSSSNFIIFNNTFNSSLSSRMNEFITIGRAGNVEIKNNFFQGDNNLPTSRTIFISNAQTIDISDNSFNAVASQSAIMYLRSNALNMSNNWFEHCVSGTSFFEVYSSNPFISENQIINSTGYVVLELSSPSAPINFTENAIVDSNFDYFTETNILYGDLNGEEIVIGPNYWGVEFNELFHRTFDSKRDARLATIYYESIYLDRVMTQEQLPPPSQAILDLEQGTIGGTIDNEFTLVVHAGLYYSDKSIILRHPTAQLVLEAGVHIIFASYSSIRIDEGVLKILGTDEEQVYLTPTSKFTGEYESNELENSTEWRGIYFGQNAEPSLMSDTNEYISGSIIRKCNLSNAGSTASIHLNGVSVILDGVKIEFSDFSVNTYGVYFQNSPGPIFANDVHITAANNVGMFIHTPEDRVTLNGLNISMSASYGLYLVHPQDTRIVDSIFDQNNNRQIYSFYGNGDFNMTSCTIINGIDFGAYFVARFNNFHITDTHFSANKKPIYFQRITSSDYILRMVSNTFENNICDSSCNTIEIM